MIKQRGTFHFNPPNHFKGDFMIGILSLEVYNALFNINTTYNKFQRYTDNFDEFSLKS